MIRDLSQTLRVLLTQPNVPRELATAQVVFDVPGAGFKPSQTTIDLFLYDIREDLELRSNETTVTRESDRIRIQPPPWRMACSYLVTAWPVGGEELALQEHRLLSQVAAVLKRYPTLPTGFLQGRLREQQPPLPMTVAPGDGLKEPHEFWTAIGNHLRPSLGVRVTLSLALDEPAAIDATAVSQHEVRIGDRAVTTAQSVVASSAPTAFTIGGRVLEAAQTPALDVTVSLVEPNLVSTADTDGRYILRSVAPGNYRLRVQRGGATLKEVPITIPARSGSDYNIVLSPSALAS